ncbi:MULTISPECIES: 4a-hydroxytetrahydrobiopterin dehydratase [Prochlorococcus]|uniref:Putative pterin-4-alpha-carbinolamine dehydratase n=1 Tax=Prochlorococcus marinus (strain SARG / CCMP1375 / SS120) TaxID=167539 RepID=PHS_PROMA|nr:MULTISPECIES: 4a-hydroxytetrahydrobiopterin dehydratase [Prochlorococcus]Q7VD93.1 RecName: Full=Putative pterin-4-alpha-carbinolamine dehydratase; Short=PHS; AltName: Full=4-alpha-hydroxy-tetrahydropterin dehydratase; AltName: Full=Pterin carbinolamine dehydratase; Short=PCD [Prochlorococcus marinus subsp. marinus str. CCMP1375]AAP99535.1 Pterin-4a-carbinolamine dehydratase [Prochlorococcus marinus subsp. marinus str. CCMP1375]KGG11192.1 Pterin-4-alpha-carbinolamine dehydratase [Prochlorococc
MENKLLSSQEIQELRKSLPTWEEAEGKLVKRFKFTNFIEAFGFMTKIAIISESLSHHPEWTNIYSEVIIRLSTHDMGGITMLDYKLAKAIDAIKYE